MKIILTNETIFLNNLRTLIKNLLIDNKNYNGYYNNKSSFDMIVDTKERAMYILEQIENTKHLVIGEIE